MPVKWVFANRLHYISRIYSVGVCIIELLLRKQDSPNIPAAQTCTSYDIYFVHIVL